MKVLKFGGSSVSSPDRVRAVMDILIQKKKQGENFTVVFSAFGGVTDLLIEMSEKASVQDSSYLELLEEFKKRHISASKELIGEDLSAELELNHRDLEGLLQGISLTKEVSKRTMDHVLSFGERNSAFIISHALKKQGFEAEYLDARKIIQSDSSHGNASVDFDQTNRLINAYYKEHLACQIVTGFIASAPDGSTSTLGRGGSDYTASIIGSALNAEAIEIWTDVDGVLTANPKLVKEAFSLRSLSYKEAMEMSHFGAKVIYAPTIKPALINDIPLYIKNTFKPQFPGTLISNQSEKTNTPVKGISSINDIALLTLEGNGMVGVPGIAARLFGTLSRDKINVILITQASSEQSITFALMEKEAARAKRILDLAFEFEIQRGDIEPLKIENDLSIVAIIGENMKSYPGIAGKLFQILGKNGVNVIAIAQGSSELNISCVIKKEDSAKAQNAIHEIFFLSETRQLNIFMVGVGLIGSTLLKQIKEQAHYLKEKQNVKINIVGLANSRKMLFNQEGIGLEKWEESLVSSESMNLSAFIEKMIACNLSNSIFLDNTAGDDIAPFYETILDASISISTPNKVAASSSYKNYEQLKLLAKKRHVHFMYETNVGAGLPVISTLQDLINSGDEIIQIEGVLSGSLSYIFNSFHSETKFSKIVLEAKELGFTEPDPREDLSGLDVRRKIIILARDAGFAIEAEDVEIKGVLPESCMTAEDIPSFFEELEKQDAYFSELVSKAEEDGKRLRMIAELKEGKAKISLQSVSADNPFYNLSGSDNMIVFTSKRYLDRPLVIRGPGAGAEVTAAGVFAEVLRILNFLS